MHGPTHGMMRAVAVVAALAVAMVAGLLFALVCGPLVTSSGTHAAEDAQFGLIVFMPLWIAGAWGVALAIGLAQGWAGRRAGFAWAAWTAIAGLAVGAVTGLNEIIVLAFRSGPAGVAGYNLDRLDLYIPVVLWVASAVTAVAAMLLPSGRPRSSPG